jgi:purine-nucleoside phosphorylase
VLVGGYIGMVLGSGLGDFVEVLQDSNEIPYSDLEGFAAPTVAGHQGSLCIGTLSGRLIVVMRGRVHAYEGHGARAVVRGVRTLVHGGASAMIITNAAGGLDPSFGVGELMLIRDHINLTAMNPLMGTDSLEVGPRFPDMTRAWDPRLRRALQVAAKRESVTLHSGVYAGVLGPSYETPAEVEMIRRAGADAVGMSTVLEAIAICQMGGRLAGFSVISNAAAGTGDPDDTLNHEEVKDAALLAKDGMIRVMTSFVASAANWLGEP